MKRMITCILCVAALVALTAANVMCADEPKLFQDNPQLRATLEQWEAEADPVVKQYIAVLRTGNAKSINTVVAEMYALKAMEKSAALVLFDMLGVTREVPVLTSPAKDSRVYNEATGTITLVHTNAVYTGFPCGEMAAVILGSIGEPAVEPLIFVLKSTNNIVRANAATALGYIKDARAAEPLIAASSDTNRDVCRAVISALIKLNDVKAVPVLISALSNKDAHIRYVATKALGTLRDPRAIEPLIATLNVADRDTYCAVILALVELNDIKAVPALISALSNKDANIRCAAAEGLKKLKDTRAVAPLIVATEDKDCFVQWSAISALRELNDVRAVPALISALSNKDVLVRYFAANGLGELKDSRAVAPLIVSLGDKEGLVRGAAANNLGELKDSRAVAPLIVALEDKDELVRNSVSYALVTLGEPAVEPLILVLNSTNNNDVRENVVFALKMLMPHFDQAKLTNLTLEATSSDIRCAAAVQLTDQALLGKVVVESKDADVRVIVVWKLDDPIVLAGVAKNDVDAAVRQAATNKQAVKTQVVDLGGGVQIELVLIAPGSFKMGSDKGRADEVPVHEVQISEPFYIGKYEVSQEQWEKVMGSNPSTFKEPKNPVTDVCWDDCQVFLKKLNEKIGGSKFSLPTEAQWEYACRAGSTSEYYWGDDKGAWGKYAWLKGNSGGKPHPVCNKLPNAWGFYDMIGNVWEWCADWYDENYYKNSTALNPIGPATGKHRVLRGGSWDDGNLVFFQCALRGYGSPTNRFISFGFRCARTL